MRKRQAHPFTGGRKAKPTKRHKPVIWEGILGTVYAASPAGEVRYFDYNWDDARAFAEVDTEGADLRIAKPRQVDPYPVRYYSRQSDCGPSYLQTCLWAVRK